MGHSGLRCAARLELADHFIDLAAGLVEVLVEGVLDPSVSLLWDAGLST